MSDLALAAFAAETGGHVVEEPRERRFKRFRREFDEAAFRSTLAARRLRFVGRSEAGYPSLLRELYDPPPGLFLRGSGAAELKTLEDENRKLKKLLAEAMLDNAALQDITARKRSAPTSSDIATGEQMTLRHGSG